MLLSLLIGGEGSEPPKAPDPLCVKVYKDRNGASAPEAFRRKIQRDHERASLNRNTCSSKHSVKVVPAIINSDPVAISMDDIVCAPLRLPHATFPSNMAGAGDVK